jgi:hypothetical protein
MTDQTLEERRLELDREKWRDEKSLRERELALNEREQQPCPGWRAFK